MKIVFFWHSKPIRDKFWTNSKYVFFDNAGWKIHKNGKRINLSLDEFSKKPFFTDYNINQIVQEIRNYTEVWSRWFSLGDQNELIIRGV